MNFIKTIIQMIDKYAKMIPADLPLLAARLVIFTVFWRSVQTKIVGMTVFGQHLAFWNLGGSTKIVFQYEYGISNDFLIYAGTLAEFFFPLMLLFGLFTRVGAIGLLGVTAVIQFFVYPDAWLGAHMFWAALLFVILREGGGRISLDYLITREKS